jgi:hypothetical protein
MRDKSEAVAFVMLIADGHPGVWSADATIVTQPSRQNQGPKGFFIPGTKSISLTCSTDSRKVKMLVTKGTLGYNHTPTAPWGRGR